MRPVNKPPAEHFPPENFPFEKIPFDRMSDRALERVPFLQGPISLAGLYFSANDGTIGFGLWKVEADGDVVQLAPGSVFSPREFTAFAGEL